MRVEAHQEPAAGGRADRVESVVTAWASENPRSAALHTRARQLLPGGVTHDMRRAVPFPLAVERAQGARKQDLDGHELICYVMGHGSLLLGHCHPAVVAAVREQATRSFHPGACHELESMPGGAVGGRASVLDHLGGRPDDPRRVAHPGTHNAHPLSAAAGVTTLGLVASGEAQDRAARLAAALRGELTSVFEQCGVPGRAYGTSSTFHLLLGPAGPEELDPVTLKSWLAPPLSSALHCGMLREGVQLFHGSGFVSTAHGEREVEQTAAALAVTLRQLQAEGLV